MPSGECISQSDCKAKTGSINTSFYIDLNQNKCLPCNPSDSTYCTSCIKAQVCLTCDANDKKYILYNDMCLSKCPAGTYMYAFIISSEISANSVSQFSCLTACPIGYFADTKSQVCQSCSGNCSNCQSLSICLQCFNGSFKFNG